MPAIQSVGQSALHAHLGGNLPEPFTQSVVGSSDKRTHETSSNTVEYYPATFANDGSLRENLRFALKNEPLGLRIIHASLIGTLSE